MVGMLRAFSTSFCGVALDGGEHAAHHAARAQVAHQGARVEIADDGHAGAARKRSAAASMRQLLAMGENSRTTRPSMYGPRGFVVVRSWCRSCRFGDWSG